MKRISLSLVLMLSFCLQLQAHASPESRFNLDNVYITDNAARSVYSLEDGKLKRKVMSALREIHEKQMILIDAQAVFVEDGGKVGVVSRDNFKAIKGINHMYWPRVYNGKTMSADFVNLFEYLHNNGYQYSRKSSFWYNPSEVEQVSHPAYVADIDNNLSDDFRILTVNDDFDLYWKIEKGLEALVKNNLILVSENAYFSEAIEGKTGVIKKTDLKLVTGFSDSSKQCLYEDIEIKCDYIQLFEYLEAQGYKYKKYRRAWTTLWL